MEVARLTFAARRRSGRPFRIFPLTIYEANFREKLTNNFQFQFGTTRKITASQALSDIKDLKGEMRS